MSLILKGIDLPTDGKPIRLVITSNGDAVEVWRDGLAKAYHPNSAIQIPKDHGRLIDADEIWFDHSVARSLDDGHNWDELVATKDGICGVPTILEAEE